jgi:predicted RNA-binding protein YlxR (DUF448 family)
VDVDPPTLLVDPGRRRPGRGAWLHPNPECLQLALRRRAFERALRRSGPLEAGELTRYINQLTGLPGPANAVRERADSS